jgi:hypothetical protein
MLKDVNAWFSKAKATRTLRGLTALDARNQGPSAADHRFGADKSLFQRSNWISSVQSGNASQWCNAVPG